MKLVWLLVLAVVACRVFLGRWPWQFLGGNAARKRELERARRLLRLDERADEQTIREAHRRMLTEVHPDRGGSEAQVHEVNDARDLLLEDLRNKQRDILK